MARRAGIGNPELLGEFGRYEAEGVTAHKVVGDSLFNPRHVAGRALAPRAHFSMMRMFADSPMESGGVIFCMAAETQLVANDNKIRWVFIAVHLMAIKATHLAVIHHTLDKIIALHTVLVRRAILPVIEILGPQARFFKLPDVDESLTW